MPHFMSASPCMFFFFFFRNIHSITVCLAKLQCKDFEVHIARLSLCIVKRIIVHSSDFSDDSHQPHNSLHSGSQILNN